LGAIFNSLTSLFVEQAVYVLIVYGGLLNWPIVMWFNVFPSICGHSCALICHFKNFHYSAASVDKINNP
jgi:hypothetical protein